MMQTTVTLGPELCIAQASAARDTLLAALAAAPQSLALDLSEVTDFDSAGVQLLLATRRSMEERGAALHITAASLPVRRALDLFALSELFALGAVEPRS